jgi:hypothetical protein
MNIKILNLLKSPQKDRKEKNRGDEPILVKIHLHGNVTRKLPL